ncbi:MAG: HD domain-containing phosphohydrolase [bacterium]
MTSKNLIQIDETVSIPLFYLISIIIIFFSVFSNSTSIDDFINIVSLFLSILVRKELYFHRSVLPKLDLFKPIFILITLSKGLLYSLIVANISIVLAHFVTKFFNTSPKLALSQERYSYLETLQKEIDKEKLNRYFIEWIITIVSFIFLYHIPNLLMINDIKNSMIFLIALICVWNFIEKIAFQIYQDIKVIYVDDYAKKFITHTKIQITSTIIEILIQSVFFVTLFYTFESCKIYFAIILGIYALSSTDNTYISNQVITFITVTIDLLEKKDRYTFDHSYRVALISYNIAKQLSLEPDRADRIYKAALIHDFGKIIVPDQVLQKKDKLTWEEFEIIKLHVRELKNLLSPIYEFIKEIVDIAELHHERLDGSGYPYGYSHQKIPLESRIISIADTFDALIIDRPYRPAFSFHKAISILKDDAEKNRLDKQLVEMFIKAIPHTEIIESVKRVKTMLKVYQGKIISNMIGRLSDFIDEII